MASQNLVIVESPAKARTISKMLGNNYKIMASMGHIRDLPEHSFGVDIQNNFAPQYEDSKSRVKIINELKSAAKGADHIYLAPDPDREGEAIAWHLREILKKSSKADFHRVTFHEITKSAIAKAFEHPYDVNMNLVDSQQARRVLDRLVGYQISPLLWSRIEKGISAGRVQSVALRLVCEREREILDFKPEEYWVFIADFEAGKGSGKIFSSKLFKINGDKFKIGDKIEADRVYKNLKSIVNYAIDSVETAPRKKNAPPPFITSTLQQAAGANLGFSANTTMKIAQQLYEGIDVGAGGPTGLITYMRTDAFNIADEARDACRKYIASNYGQEYVPAKPNFFKSKASAQGAHEAIRPTDVTMTPDMLKGSLDAMQMKLYTLIWKRFLACQMAPAEQSRTTVDVSGKAGSDSYTFRTVATSTVFPGYLKVYNIEDIKPENPEEEELSSINLTLLKKGENCLLKGLKNEQKFTEPPPRFSEATLIKELEANGIGRPSTYASIVNTIQTRLYVNKDKGKLIPSELGFKVCDYLMATLPDLFQIGFTADMENRLDKIEEGDIQWTEMLKEFYGQFSTWLDSAKHADAPDTEKAENLIALFSSFKNWEKPEKRNKRTYDDKKFFDSVSKKFATDKKISGKQWQALLMMAVKYAGQLPTLKSVAAKHAFTEELEAAIKGRAESEARKEATAVTEESRQKYDRIFNMCSAIKWNAPEKKGPRVYDDEKFFKSLKQQAEGGKELSEKQIGALKNMISKYKEQITDKDTLAEFTGASASSDDAEGGASDSAGAAAVPSAEVTALLAQLESVETWGEPVKKGKRVYDDKSFYESLKRQHEGGRVLSDKQLAALKKLASKYAAKEE